MRWILLILVVANVALFGWWHRWFSHESEPREIQSQRLRVVPLERLGNPSNGLRKAPVSAGGVQAGAQAGSAAAVPGGAASGASSASVGAPAGAVGAAPSAAGAVIGGGTAAGGL